MRLPVSWGWLWIVPLAFYTSAYGSAMALFAFGIPNLDQSFLMWVVMTPAGALAGLGAFIIGYVPVRCLGRPRLAAAVGIMAGLVAGTVASGASLTLLGGPV